MASPVNAALCAMVATAIWTLLGYALGRHLLPRALAIGAAPVMGWAVHSAAALPIFILIGFSPIAVVGVAALCVVIGGGSILAPAAASDNENGPAIPAWAYAAAAALALVPTVAILPKFVGDAVYLADPVYDHSKIAIVDAMMRLGLPPVDPVFGEYGAPGRLAYYYLWHFSAAELALPLGTSGWEADIGLTWFTAFASLSLMMGVAVFFSKRPGAAIWVVAIAAATSLRTTLNWVFGADAMTSFLLPPTGFTGWLFQSAWAPQHLMSASCVVTSMLLIARYAHRQSAALLLTLILTVAAGFESSSYVGGITFAIAALAAAPALFFQIDPPRRLRFGAGLALAAVLAICLAAPFVVDQVATVAARGGGQPLTIHPFAVLGDMFSPSLGRLLDLPAYWLVLLPIEFPAAFVAGALGLAVLARKAASGFERLAVAALASLAAVALLVSWLLVGTLGSINDLGLRAVLPAVTVLIAGAAAAIALRPRRTAIFAIALGGLVLSLPETASLIRSNIAGSPSADGKAFAQSPEMWEAVRRYASRAARVANNPLFLQHLTPWPVNMSWALLADRSSCFAGRELTLAFAPLPTERREAIDAQFLRVFDGQGTPEDVSDMANKYGCEVVAVVPGDKAWNNDPFAASPDYRLAENRDDKWRIYVRMVAAR